MCGLYGFSYHGNKVSKQKLDKLINSLAKESTIRGTHATGIAYNNAKGKMVVTKEPKAAIYMNFQLPKNVRAVIGHVRHATQGKPEMNHNNHPFKGTTKNGSFALAHNGVLTNDKALRNSNKLPTTKIETDSYVAVQLLEKAGAVNHKTLADMAEKVNGSFVFTVIDSKDTIYFVKGDNPLSIMYFPTIGLYVYASTEEILWKALVDSEFTHLLKSGDFEEVVIDEGQILSINKEGERAYTAFEFDYYASSPKWWRVYTSPAEPDYADDLKTIAEYLGYSADFVDRLLRQNFTLEEIEDFLYGEMDLMHT